MAIKKSEQSKFSAQERQAPREYISGESHYVQGQRYLLSVRSHDGPPQVTVRNKTTLNLLERTGSDTAQRGRVLQAWYRQQFKALVPELIERWAAVVGVEVKAWGVKQMKTRWGTCNIGARRIWLNLELAKKPLVCLEYVYAAVAAPPRRAQPRPAGPRRVGGLILR